MIIVLAVRCNRNKINNQTHCVKVVFHTTYYLITYNEYKADNKIHKIRNIPRY